MDITDEDDFKPPIMDVTYEEEQKMDDDLDYALAYCLQTEFEEDSLPDNISNKSWWPELKDASKIESSASSHSWNSIKDVKKMKPNDEEDADYKLALQLQKEFAAKVGVDPRLHTISSGASNSSLIQNRKKIKAEQQQHADHMLALKLQAELVQENETKLSSHGISSANLKSLNRSANHWKPGGGKLPASIVDPEWEILDPVPDIHSLFFQFNQEFFWGALEGVEVRWSPRMTLCAGLCSYEGHGGLCSVRISQPLLKYRPRRDLVETLLHEMIHAYLFVTHNNKDHNAHGPEFLKHMYRINKQTGTRISVYHSFHDEVDLHRKHWWKCNGPCQHHPPFFGIVKRAMNRAPSPRDPWWAQHQATCGGTYIKIKEPEGSVQKKNLNPKSEEVSGANQGVRDIRNFFSNTSPINKFTNSPPTNKFTNSLSTNTENQRNNGESLLRQPGVPNIHTMSSSDKSNKDVSGMSSVKPFSGKGFVLGSSVSGSKVTTAVGSDLRNNPNTRPLGNQVTRRPLPGINFSPQRKGTKNPQNPMQKKASPNQPAKKHPGSVNMFSNKIGTLGTALKSQSASGSRTIVIPRNSKAAPKLTTTENSNDYLTVPFKGNGLVLGGGSKTVTEGGLRFSSHVSVPSTSSIKKEHNSNGFLDNGFPKIPGSKRNIKSEKTESPSVKKEMSRTQTKINMYAVSPEGKNSSSNVSSESDHENDSSSKLVKCPVCGNMLKDFRINSHLDDCLKRFS